MENKKLLQSGNSKLSRDILIFNLPPGRSCLNCVECYRTCYARKAYRQYPAVKISWDYNLKLARENKDLLFNSIVMQLKSTKKCVVRIHSSGDFFDQDYIDLWARIIKLFPGKAFYAYTKVKEILNFDAIEALENFNLINSFIDGKLNYGPADYCNELVKDHGAFLCPCGISKDRTCGQDCNYCVTGSWPVFIIH